MNDTSNEKLNTSIIDVVNIKEGRGLGNAGAGMKQQSNLNVSVIGGSELTKKQLRSLNKYNTTNKKHNDNMKRVMKYTKIAQKKGIPWDEIKKNWDKVYSMGEEIEEINEIDQAKYEIEFNKSVQSWVKEWGHLNHRQLKKELKSFSGRTSKVRSAALKILLKKFEANEAANDGFIEYGKYSYKVINNITGIWYFEKRTNVSIWKAKMDKTFKNTGGGHMVAPNGDDIAGKEAYIASIPNPKNFKNPTYYIFSTKRVKEFAAAVKKVLDTGQVDYEHLVPGYLFHDNGSWGISGGTKGKPVLPSEIGLKK